MTIEILSEASVPTPAAGSKTLFINADKGNQLYWKNSDGSFTPYTGDTEAMSGEIAQAWTECICCALKDGTISASDYQDILAAGYQVVSERVTLDAETGDYRSTVSVGSRNSILSSISVDDETVAVAIGGPHQIVVTFNPTNVTNQNVTYITSDATKATVSASGLIVGVAAGIAIITVIPNADPSKAKTITVTVS